MDLGNAISYLYQSVDQLLSYREMNDAATCSPTFLSFFLAATTTDEQGISAKQVHLLSTSTIVTLIACEPWRVTSSKRGGL
jgi:hypothetical protein